MGGKLPYCPECGEELDEDSKFCPKCGASLQEEGEPRRSDIDIVGGISTEDFLHRPPFIIGIAGILMIIGSIGSWYTWGYAGINLNLNGSANGIRAAVAFLGLTMIYSSVVDLGYVDILEEAVPTFPVSSVCGIVGLIGSLAALSSPFSAGWGIYLTIIASIIALFAAFRNYEQK